MKNTQYYHNLHSEVDKSDNIKPANDAIEYDNYQLSRAGYAYHVCNARWAVSDARGAEFRP